MHRKRPRSLGSLDLGRILGIDYGKKRVGLALSDPLGMFASPLMTLDVLPEKAFYKALKDIIETHEVEKLVIGLPLNHQSEETEAAQSARALGDRIQAETSVSIYYQDERFTSVIAIRALQAQGVQPSRNKGLVDQTAAALILQQYLDRFGS